jgi:phosphoribosylglycinamide formyltransferase-1
VSLRVGVLASGAGTNLQAILDRVHGRDGVEVVAVGSDKAGAQALARAEAAGVPTATFPVERRGDPMRGGPAGAPLFAGGRSAASSDAPAAPPPAPGTPTAGTHFADRVARDAAMADWLEERAVDLVVLAGYMQLLSPAFLARFAQRVINVHPALLPAFPGIGAVEQALAHGVKVFGVTVHFVDEGVDTGAIILQRAVDLPEATEPETVRRALRPIEHELLCEAVRLIARDAVRIDPGNPRRVLIAS